MMSLIGTDEAGYGPNLGPLVVTATVWNIPSAHTRGDLYALLEDLVTSQPRDEGDSRLWIADSKTVFQSRNRLGPLERGVLAAWVATGAALPRTWKGLWSAFDQQITSSVTGVPCYAYYDEPLPVEADRSEIEGAAARLARGMSRLGISLAAIRPQVIFAGQFNRMLDAHHNKSTTLSRLTLDLVRDVLAVLSTQQTVVVCDKHGGRNRYAGLLQETFPDTLIEIYREGREESVYRMGPPDRRVEFRFTARGERALPAALASMVSKYLREMAMRAFNFFWCSRQANLRPTAGYPGDARRFMQQIADLQKRLRIDDALLWRRR
jgi:ribonuclease HII